MTKKILSFFMIVSMFIVVSNTSISNAQGEDYDSKYIKVGISRNVPSKSTIKLSGKGFTVGLENGDISELFTVNNQDLVANIKKFSYHIELSEKFNSYDRAIEKTQNLNSLGVDSYVVYNQGFQVWIGEFSTEDSARKFLENSIILGRETASVSKNETLTSLTSANGEKIIAFDKSQKIYMKSIGDLTKIENKRYRGYTGFVNDSSKLAVINYVKIGDYLKGVVPKEMPASWNIEALKAQSVAARNYALRTLGKHASQGFDLCDAQHCQVYYGYDEEHPNTNRAIEETTNKVLKYNGKIAETLYSSCSGGYTSNNEDIWNGSPIPYLRGKEDPYSKNTPQSNWTYTISKVDAANKLKAKGYDVGKIISLETVKDSFGGRVLELKVTGTDGVKILPKEKVREVFGNSNVKSTNYSIEGAWANVNEKPIEIIKPEPIIPEAGVNKSDTYIYMLSGNSNFSEKKSINNINVMTADGLKKIKSSSQKLVVSNGLNSVSVAINTPEQEKPTQPVVPKPTIPTTPGNLGESIVFKGSGFGHGVGMSQHGANNMAKAGHNFIEILEFYYTGARIE